MVKKKDLVIVALATFCLTATLFMVKPIGSQSQVDLSPPNTYDSWVDLNDNGIIDIYDAIMFSNHFDTSGDPTKNVNVTNLPAEYKIDSDLVHVGWMAIPPYEPQYDGNWTSNWHDSRGFNRMFVYARPVSALFKPMNYSTNILLTYVAWSANSTFADPWAEDNRVEMVTDMYAGSYCHLNITVWVTNIVGETNSTQLSYYTNPINLDETAAEIRIKGLWYKLFFYSGVPNMYGEIDLAVTIYLWKE
jgi:hypothetical protein